MKKRICIITNSFPHSKDDSNDATVFIRDFAISLAEKNYEVFVLTPMRKGLKNDFENITVHFFPWLEGNFKFGFISLDLGNPIHLLKLLSMIVSGFFHTLKFVRKNKIDFCLSMWAVPTGLFALAAKNMYKIPYSVWALGSDIYRIQDYPFGSFMLKKILKNSEQLYADGIQISKDVEEISGRKCIFLSSGRILNNSKHEINYKKFDSTKTNFMFLGRYHASKGIDLLIDAIGLLTKEEREKTLFHIFGEGQLEEELQNKVKKLDLDSNTFINGHLEGHDVYSYLSQSNYVIIPSRSDSLSAVLFEAIQADKPVIITNVGDQAKLVKEYKMGIITETNANSLASAIRQIMQLDKKQIDSFHSRMDELRTYLNNATKNRTETFLGTFENPNTPSK